MISNSYCNRVFPGPPEFEAPRTSILYRPGGKYSRCNWIESDSSPFGDSSVVTAMVLPDASAMVHSYEGCFSSVTISKFRLTRPAPCGIRVTLAPSDPRVVSCSEKATAPWATAPGPACRLRLGITNPAWYTTTLNSSTDTATGAIEGKLH